MRSIGIIAGIADRFTHTFGFAICDGLSPHLVCPIRANSDIHVHPSDLALVE
jgi:hypothetical protein